MNSTCGACPLVDALRRIREDMDRASLSGDEWAMEWMSDVWSDLPLAVRAAGGDQDAAHELAAQKLAAGLAAPTNHDTEQQARARLAALIGYESDEHDAEFEQRLDAYRAAILNSAADDIAAVDFHPNAKAQRLNLAQGFARRLRSRAAGAES